MEIKFLYVPTMAATLLVVTCGKYVEKCKNNFKEMKNIATNLLHYYIKSLDYFDIFIT